jgi:ankyrin repeat protein
MNKYQNALLVMTSVCMFSPLGAVSAAFKQARTFIEKSPSKGNSDFTQLEQLINNNPTILNEQNDEKVTVKDPLLDQTAFTLLHYAAFNNSNDVLQLIIDKGCSQPGWINMAVSDKITTPLHVAVQTKSSDEMLGILLDAGASVLVLNADKKTPLHIASELNDKDMVVCLLKHGGLGVIGWQDATNKSPGDLATNAAIKELFVPITPERLQDLLKSKKIDLLTTLISIRPQALREKAKDGSAFLHALADNPDSNLLRSVFKLQDQPSLDIQNQSGQTPLYIAAARYCSLPANDPSQTARKAILISLLRAGAKITLADSSGRTPLQLAKQQQTFPQTSANNQYVRATEVVALLEGTAPTTSEGAKKLLGNIKEQLANLSGYVELPD